MQLELVSRQPETVVSPTPLLFVHGAWHAAWCWQPYFLPYFAQHGYACYALSLRGHGGSQGNERLRWWRMANYVADVVQVAASLPAPPIIIGHSAGGFIVQKYLETNQAPAAVLLASVAPTGGLAHRAVHGRASSAGVSARHAHPGHAPSDRNAAPQP